MKSFFRNINLENTKTSILFALFLFTFVLVNSQNINHIKVHTITKDGIEKDGIEIPIAQCENKTVETKINTYIQLNELHNIYLNNDSTLFDKVCFYDGDYHFGMRTDIFYHEHRNDELCWSFDLLETQNPYTGNYVNNYYNFNPQTGDIYLCKDFIDSSKLDSFIEFVYGEICKQLGPEFMGDTNYYKENYPDSVTFCDIMLSRGKKYILNYYYFTENDIYFDVAPLLFKNDLLEIGGTEVSLPIDSIKQYLNDLGYKILVNKTINREPIQRFENKLYEAERKNGEIFYFIPYKVSMRYDSVMVFNGYAIDKDGKNFTILEDGEMNKKRNEIKFRLIDEQGLNNKFFYVFLDKKEPYGKITNVKGNTITKVKIKEY
ncbi:MAG: hypothetical protein IJ213_06140 [Bacteroidales bacterium]|nr:hypothetical protein [Bacteroidales bacterium]